MAATFVSWKTRSSGPSRDAGRRELPSSITGGVQDTRDATAPFVDFRIMVGFTAYLATIERELIQRSLERTGGNRNKAAELLRIKRTTLVEKLKRLGHD